MMGIMMQLRCMTYPSCPGDYVMARLRASAVTKSPVDVYSTLPTADHGTYAPVQVPKAKKSRKRSKRKKKSLAPLPEGAYSPVGSTGSNSKSGKSKESTTLPASVSASQAPAVEPPLLTLDDFPSLNINDKVEWATTLVDRSESMDVDDFDEATSSSGSTSSSKSDSERPSKFSTKAAFSDAGSTATTTSSTATSASGGMLLTECVAVTTGNRGGYAAALLGQPSSTSASWDSTAIATSTCASNTERQLLPPILSSSEETSEPLRWGAHRSLAEVLRKESSSSAVSKVRSSNNE
jgi:trimeric autotransporter adhesin